MSSKKSRLRLYADENIPIPSVTYLKKKGISIVHAFDFKYIEKPDKEHLRKSKSLNRVLISLDKDVKKFQGITINDHPGVILLESGDVTSPHLNLLLDKVIKHVSPAFVKDSLIRVTIDMLTQEKNGEILKKDI